MADKDHCFSNLLPPYDTIVQIEFPKKIDDSKKIMILMLNLLNCDALTAIFRYADTDISDQRTGLQIPAKQNHMAGRPLPGCTKMHDNVAPSDAELISV